MAFLNFNMDQFNLGGSESIDLKSLVAEGLNPPPAAATEERPRTALVRPRGRLFGRGGGIRMVGADGLGGGAMAQCAAQRALSGVANGGLRKGCRSTTKRVGRLQRARLSPPVVGAGP